MNPGAGKLVAGQNDRTTSDTLACRDLSLHRQKIARLWRIFTNVTRKLGLPGQDPQDQIVINEVILVHIFVNAFMLPLVCISTMIKTRTFVLFRNTDFFLNSTHTLSFVRNYSD